MGEKMSLRFSSTIQKLKEQNPSFDSALLRVCYTGKNRNRIIIPKESIENAISTATYCPIVCNYDIDEDTIGAHDVGFVPDDSDGESLRMVNLTDGIGVVPENADWFFEDVEENGVVHTYFNIEVLIWKRSAVYEKIKKDGVTAQSMEIDIARSHKKDGFLVIDDFSFTAFCLLGDNIEPCFEGASLNFALNGLGERLNVMIEDFRRELREVQQNNNFTTNAKGGVEELDKSEILAKFALSTEQLNFDIENMTPEELEKRLSETYSLSGEQLRHALYEAVETPMVETEWGTTPRYWYYDYDDSEVFATEFDSGVLYGFTYTVNGDNVVLDFDTKKKKKITVVDFDEGDSTSEPTLFKLMFNKFENSVKLAAEHKCKAEREEFSAKEQELRNDIERYSAQVSSLTEDLNKFKKFKEDADKKAKQSQFESIFANFEDLEGVEEFNTLRSENEDGSLEISATELEAKCYELRGRNMPTKRTFSAHKSNVRLPIDKTKAAENEPYGGIFAEFPPR